MNFYRRLILPALLIMTGASPAMIMLVVLQTNVVYVAFLLSNKIYKERRQRTNDLVNELLIIAVIYLILLLVD